MTEYFDTSRVHDDPSAWDARAQQVVTAIECRRNGIDALGGAPAAWLAAGLLLAASIVLAFAPSPFRPRATSADWVAVIAPSDASSRAIVLPDRPPALGALLLTNALERGTR